VNEALENLQAHHEERKVKDPLALYEAYRSLRRYARTPRQNQIVNARMDELKELADGWRQGRMAWMEFFGLFDKIDLSTEQIERCEELRSFVYNHPEYAAGIGATKRLRILDEAVARLEAGRRSPQVREDRRPAPRHQPPAQPTAPQETAAAGPTALPTKVEGSATHAIDRSEVMEKVDLHLLIDEHLDRVSGADPRLSFKPLEEALTQARQQFDAQAL